MIDFAESDAATVADEVRCELYKSADPAWDVVVAMLGAFISTPGEALARQQILALLPVVGQQKTAKGLVGELGAWRERSSTRWFAPTVVADIDVLIEVLGDMAGGATDITSRFGTDVLKLCPPRLYNLVSTQKTVKQGQKSAEVLVQGVEAARLCLKRLVDLEERAQQSDVDAFTTKA